MPKSSTGSEIFGVNLAIYSDYKQNTINSRFIFLFVIRYGNKINGLACPLVSNNLKGINEFHYLPSARLIQLYMQTWPTNIQFMNCNMVADTIMVTVI